MGGSSLSIDKDVSVPMRDGTVLRADVYRPAASGKYPVILQRTPYNKNLLAGVVALFALVMLSLALFFTLAPYWGNALSALAVAGVELAVAVVLIIYAGSLTPPAELEMVREMRDMALEDLEEEVSLAQEELVSLRQEIHRFIRNPVDTLLPALIGPILSAVTRALSAAKK